MFALTMLALPPLLINSYAGIRNVDRAVVEAAAGMGMEPAQVLRQSAFFPGVLLVSIIAVWAAYSTRQPRAVWAAIAFPWTYFLVVIATTGLLILIVRLR